jgi:hypothetical protein
MTDKQTHRPIDAFFAQLGDHERLLKNESSWFVLADQVLAGTTLDDQRMFWLDLEKNILKREETHGHIHKGQIYWRLANVELLRGDLEECITSLTKSWEEDSARGQSMSASRGLLSVLKPLVYPYDRKTDARLRNNRNVAFYNGMSQSEKAEFEQEVMSAHNHVAQNAINLIKPESFTFLLDPEKNQIAKDTYYEVMEFLRLPVATQYSSIFSIGSIAEVMLDDLLERNHGEVWFKGNTEKYNGTLMFMGTKIDALRKIVDAGSFALPKHVVIKFLIIAEYRNLIHPNRRHGLEFIPNPYVAFMLFTFLSHIASHLWQHNVDKYLGKHA